jgi:hypothetical protein
MQRVLMESKRPTCVITLYNEETETISHYQVAQSSISSVIDKRASFDVPLADFGNKIDDDFAANLGR